MSSKSTRRDLALTIARAQNLHLGTVVAADEVAKDDEEFLTAICISADLQGIMERDNVPG